MKHLNNFYFILALLIPMSGFSNEEYFRFLLQESEVGYVLLGNKPVCFETYHEEPPPIGHLDQRSHFILKNGSMLELPHNKFLFSKQRKGDVHYLFFVNKEALRKVFEENRSLFQYVISPLFTFEMLLKSLEDPNGDFFETIHQDTVLIGIILGFGTENSLYCARMEEFENEGKVTPPYPCKCKRVVNAVGIPMRISFGEKMEEESERRLIENRLTGSSESLMQYSPTLFFSRIKGEKSALIKEYEETQLKIQRLLDSPTFLEEVKNILKEIP